MPSHIDNHEILQLNGLLLMVIKFVYHKPSSDILQLDYHLKRTCRIVEHNFASQSSCK